MSVEQHIDTSVAREKSLNSRLQVPALAIGLLLLAASQYLFLVDAAVLGLGLSLLALPLILWGFFKVDALPQHTGGEATAGPHQRYWRLVGSGLVVLGLVVAVLFLALEVAALVTAGVTVWPYIIAMLLFAAGLILLRDRASAQPRQAEGLPWVELPRYEFVALLLILVLAASLRFWRLDIFPPGIASSEALNGIEAREVLQGSFETPFRSDWSGHSSGWKALVNAGFIAAFDSGVASLRMAAALAGVLSVLVTYLLARRLFGLYTALAAALFLSLSRWHLALSRTDAMVIMGLPFVLLALYFFLRGLHVASRPGSAEHNLARLSSFGWSGFWAGFAYSFYLDGYVAPVLLVLMGLAFTLVGRWQGPRSRLRQMALALVCVALGFLVAAGPMVRYHAQEGGWELLSLSEPPPTQTPWMQARDATLLFHYRGDCNSAFNVDCLPMLDPFVGALFLVGLAWALLRWRQPHYQLLAVWALAPLVLAAVVITDAPLSVRLSSVIPVVAILAGRALVLIWARLTQWREASGMLRAHLRAWTPALVVIGAVIASWNLTLYFGWFVHHPQTAAHYNQRAVVVGDELNRLPPGYVPRYLGHEDVHHEQPVLHFTAPGVQARAEDYRHVADWLLPSASQGIFFVMPDREAATALRYYYPLGELQAHNNSRGQQQFWSFRVNPEINWAKQGLTAYYWSGRDAVGDPSFTIKNNRMLELGRQDWPLLPPFVAQWRGTLNAPQSGLYRLVVESDGAVDLTLNDQLVLSLVGVGRADASVALTAGLNPIRITLQAVAVETPRLRVLWAPPEQELQSLPSDVLFAFTDVIGLRAHYQSEAAADANRDHIDPGLNHRWYRHDDPVPGAFTAEWEGWLQPPRPGEYVFRSESSGTLELEVDGEVAVRADGLILRLTLSGERVPIRARFVQGDAPERYMRVYWRLPGREDWTLLPPDVLRPYP